MKKINCLFMCALLIGASLLSGCKKDDAEPALPKSELLAGKTGKNWKVTSMTAQTVNVIGIFVPTCQADNIFTLNTNNTVIENEGATKCDTSAPDKVGEGTWKLLSGDTQIMISSGTINETAKIIELSSSKLVVEITHSILGVTIVTFTAQ